MSMDSKEIGKNKNPFRNTLRRVRFFLSDIKKLIFLIIVLSILLGCAFPKNVYVERTIGEFFLPFLWFRLLPLYLSAYLSWIIGVLLYFVINFLFILLIAIVWEPLFWVSIVYHFFMVGFLASITIGRDSSPFLFLELLDGLISILGLYLGLKINSPTTILGDYEKGTKTLSNREILRRLKNNGAVLFLIIVFQLFSFFGVLAIIRMFA